MTKHGRQQRTALLVALEGAVGENSSVSSFLVKYFPSQQGIQLKNRRAACLLSNAR